MDTTRGVLERSTVYILINLVVVELARYVHAVTLSAFRFIDFLHSSFVSPIISRLIPAARPAIKDEDTADDSRPDVVEPTDLEDATERTPLITPALHSQPKPAHVVILSLLSPIVVATILGLAIRLIEPLQRSIVGVGADDSDGSWVWQSIGSGLVLLGAGFAVVEMLGIGAGIRAGETLE